MLNLRTCKASFSLDRDYTSPTWNWLTLLAIACSFVAAQPAGSFASERLTPIVRAVQESSPSVVNIQGQKSISQTADGTPTPPRQVNGMGTGIVIDPRGYILTNHHVVNGVRRINVTLKEGQTYVAQVIARDKKTDLAVIRIRTPRPLPIVRIGTSEDLMAGETVIAVGNAFGYEHTVTTGIISALHRNVQVNDTQQYLDLIQTDASINPGNSGGPLLNINGEMIGVNVAVRAGAQGIGFAIPVDKALVIASRMMSIEKLDNHWHGLEALSLDGPHGPVTVAKVDRQSPAQSSGLRRGDKIEQIGDTTIERSLDIERALLGRRIGERVAMRITRDGQPLELNLAVAHRSTRGRTRPLTTAQIAESSNSLQQATWETLGLKLKQEPSSSLRRLGVPYQGGMRVVSVRPKSSAAEQGVLQGDILVKMHRWTTASQRDLRFIVDHANKLSQSESVKFYIVRGEDTFFGHMSVARRGKSSVR
ncbi:MAG: PDZ domain-containing protein [Planctomycetes bacterium]|nr:PDZ domain-containing protein [Planctomycetota bacterium]